MESGQHSFCYWWTTFRVKHNWIISTPWNQPGSRAQEWSLSNQEFISQTNHNADSVPKEDRFKYVDDLTTLKIKNLLSIWLSSYNFRLHIHIPTDVFFLDIRNYLNQINQRTKNQKMFIDGKKYQGNGYQFHPKLTILNQNEFWKQKYKIYWQD